MCERVSRLYVLEDVPMSLCASVRVRVQLAVRDVHSCPEGDEVKCIVYVCLACLYMYVFLYVNCSSSY